MSNRSSWRPFRHGGGRPYQNPAETMPKGSFDPSFTDEDRRKMAIDNRKIIAELRDISSRVKELQNTVAHTQLLVEDTHSKVLRLMVASTNKTVGPLMVVAHPSAVMNESLAQLQAKAEQEPVSLATPKTP